MCILIFSYIFIVHKLMHCYSKKPIHIQPSFALLGAVLDTSFDK